ncbi:hypothetical protein D3C71_1657140 [compost metagenome]
MQWVRAARARGNHGQARLALRRRGGLRDCNGRAPRLAGRGRLTDYLMMLAPNHWVAIRPAVPSCFIESSVLSSLPSSSVSSLRTPTP